MASKAEATRAHWLSVLDRHCHDRNASGSDKYWSPKLDTASQDEIRAIQPRVEELRVELEKLRRAIELADQHELPPSTSDASTGGPR